MVIIQFLESKRLPASNETPAKLFFPEVLTLPEWHLRFKSLSLFYCWLNSFNVDVCFPFRRSLNLRSWVSLGY